MGHSFTQSELLGIFTGVVLLATFFIFRPRKKAVPAQLKLKNKSKKWNPEALVPTEGKKVYEAGAINFIFEYENKSWDAYEVLGLPAGCDFSSVEKSFQQGPQTPLARQAYELLKKHLNKI